MKKIYLAILICCTVAINAFSQACTQVTVNNSTICSGASVSLMANGGSSFIWSNGSTGAFIQVTPKVSSNYTVTASSSGCPSTTAVASIHVIQIPLTVNSKTIVSGISTRLTAKGADSYSWSNGDNTDSIQVAPTSTQTYTVTGMSSGCSMDAIATVTVISSTSGVTKVNNATICAGSTASLSAKGATSYSWSNGSTSATIQVTPKTTTSYTVSGTSSGNTTYAVSQVYVIQLPVMTVNNATVAAGTTATLTASGATYIGWSTGDSTNSITVTPTSTQTYTVTGNTDGCVSVAIATVTINNGPVTGVTTVNNVTICAGTSATLSAQGATSYTWSNGSVAPTITVSPKTTTSYTVSGTSSGKTTSAVATVFVKQSPTITINNSTICAGASATLTANGANSYFWSNGATANTITGNPKSTTSYTVTGTSSGCSGNAIGTIHVNLIENASFNYPSALVCKSGGTNPTPIITGLSGGTFKSSNPNLPIDTKTGVITLASSILATYTITYTTSGFCSGTNNFVLNIVNAPNATFAYNGSYCQKSGTALPTLFGGDSIGTFTASPTGLVFANNKSGEVDLSKTAPNTYTVTNTVNSPGCPSAIATDTIKINTIPVITVSSTTISSGMSATLTASGANSYHWSNGSTTNQITVSPSTTTSYTVSNNGLGCNANAVGKVTVNIVTKLTVNNVTICLGNSATLTALGSSTYLWSNGATSNSITITPTTKTSYTVTGTKAGISTTVVATVFVNAMPKVTVNSATICSGSGATLKAAGASSYVWSNGSINPSIMVKPTTTTTYTVTGKSLACSVTALATVVVGDKPLVTMSSINTDVTGSCNGYIAANIIGKGPFNYTWSDDPNINTNERKGMCSGSYSVSITSIGCAASAKGTIGKNPNPDSITSDKCSMNIHALTDNATVGMNNGAVHASIPFGGKNGCTPPYTYEFNGSKATVNASPYQWNKTGLGEGFYTINVTDANGKQSKFVFVISTANKTFVTPPSGKSTSTLSATAVPSCNINYDDIKTIKIQSLKASDGKGKYTFNWEVTYNTGANATQYFDQDYDFTGKKGIVTIVTNLFCTSRVTGIAQGIDEFDLSVTDIESANKLNFEIYPNPMNDKLYIVTEHDSELSIKDLTGKEIYKTKIIAGTNELQINEINSGIYFITIQNDQASITKKIIKN